MSNPLLNRMERIKMSKIAILWIIVAILALVPMWLNVLNVWHFSQPVWGAWFVTWGVIFMGVTIYSLNEVGL